MNREEASRAALEAVRNAIPTEVADQFSGFSERQRPLIPLFLALLDSTKAIAAAIADNAWDHCEPISRDFAAGCQRQAVRIGSDIFNATECPDRTRWEA